MRRTTSALLSLSALLTVSVLAAPAAGAAPQNDRPATAPVGWEKVDGTDLARIAGDGPKVQAPAAMNRGASAQADESGTFALKSARNGKFTATEKNYAAPNTGILRARSASVTGGWEGFVFEWNEATQTYALKSLANDRYVAVEGNYTGNTQNILRARSTGAGTWERFTLYYNEDVDRWALQSALNGRFVAMENSYTGSLQYALRARSIEVTGSWEQFELHEIVG
ncbi:fascin domain-containing protein [Streptomyces californicus]|uniref:fascin domain-containing protein n=1 Tax=Streptomyces californicus TaxID=67351 RepID=UPI00379D019F